MPYKPTGKPNGRPPKVPKPVPVVVPEPESKPKDVLARKDTAADLPSPTAICSDCWPDGWPKGYTGISCPHGVWARAWIPGR